MPNWCQNYIHIEGPKKLMEEIFANGEFSIQKFFPCPQELLDMPSPAPKQYAKVNMEKYGSESWYSWCIENWGTKWDPNFSDGSLKISKGKKRGRAIFSCSFESAWAPPVAAFKKFQEIYPELSLRLEYFEGGCSFFGVAEGEGGSFSDDYREYSGLKDLREKLAELPCSLAQDELEYLDEAEEESKISE